MSREAILFRGAGADSASLEGFAVESDAVTGTTLIWWDYASPLILCVATQVSSG